jgi:hypothetical protein
VPTDAPLDADQVHHLDAGATSRSKLPFLLGVVALLALAGGGTWVVMTDPFASQAVAEAPPAAADNLMGDAWSFETTESSSPGQAWFVPDEAPAGFAFTAAAAVSGAAGASAIVTEAGWSRAFASATVRADPGQVFELAASSGGDAIQLLLRFEDDDRPPFDVVVASGRGAISGQATPPLGYGIVRAGIGSVGPGSLDDLVLTRGSAADEGVSFEQGVYDVRLAVGQGLTLSRDGDLVLRAGPITVRPADGPALPGLAAQLPGESALALPDGGRVGLEHKLIQRDGRPVLTASVSGVPAGSTLVTQVLLTGPLVRSPLGVRAGGRYDRFTDDFRAEGVDSLVLGRTQDRLVLDMLAPFSIQATYQDEDTVRFVIERQAAGTVTQELTILAGFQAERVQAAGLLTEAQEHESAGRPGAALAVLERIVTEFPYDEGVLEQAGADRARLTVAADERLQVLRGDLDDAIFLGNPGRCRDVAASAEDALESWAGQPGQAAVFGAFLAEVEERAGRVLSQVDDRRRSAIAARLESFREDGRFPQVVAEMEEALAALPDPDAEGDSQGGSP